MSNPFDGCERLFAADAEIVRHDSQLYGRPVFVALRLMNANASDRFRMLALQALGQVDGIGAAADADVLNALQNELLDSTLVDFQFVFRKDQKGPDGEALYEHTPLGSAVPREARRDYFGRLDPSFRRNLVAACCEVNGSDPLAALALGLAPLSMPSRESTEKPGPDSETASPTTS